MMYVARPACCARRRGPPSHDKDMAVSSAFEKLVSHVEDPKFFELTRAELEPLWLEAANERLAQQRERIPYLGRLAEERGIDAIHSFDDLVPLLFAHSDYKSYPESLISRG